MATRSRIELIHQVLDNLGVLVPGQSPSAEDVGKVDKVIDPIIAKLQAMEITYIPDAGTASPPNAGEIEDAVFMPLAAYVTYECAAMFNMAGDAQLKLEQIRAEDDLRVLGRPPRTIKALRCDPAVRPVNIRGVGNFTTGT